MDPITETKLIGNLAYIRGYLGTKEGMEPIVERLDKCLKALGV